MYLLDNIKYAKDFGIGLFLVCIFLNQTSVFSQEYTYFPAAVGCDGTWTNGSCWLKNNTGFSSPSNSSFPPITIGPPASNFSSPNKISIIINDNLIYPSSFHFAANEVNINLKAGIEFKIQQSWYLVKNAKYKVNNLTSGGAALMTVKSSIYYNSGASISLNDASVNSLVMTSTDVVIPDPSQYNSFGITIKKGALLRVSNQLAFLYSEKNKLIIDGGKAEINTVSLGSGSTSLTDTNQVKILNLGQLVICSQLYQDGNSYFFIDDAYVDGYFSSLVVTAINVKSQAIFENNGLVTFHYLSISDDAEVRYDDQYYHIFENDGTPISYNGNNYKIGSCKNCTFDNAPYITYLTFLNYENGFYEQGTWCFNILPIYLKDFEGYFDAKFRVIRLEFDIYISPDDRVELYRAENSKLNWEFLGDLTKNIKPEENLSLTYIDDTFNSLEERIYYVVKIFDRQGREFYTSEVNSVKVPQSMDKGFMVYPNPSSKSFQVNSSRSFGDFKLTLFSIKGLELIAFNGKSLADINREFRQFSTGLNTGIYVLIFDDGLSQTVKRIQKL